MHLRFKRPFRSGFRLQRSVLLALIIACSVPGAKRDAFGQAVTLKAETAAPIQEMPRTRFAQNLSRLQDAVHACRAKASACSGDVGPDNKVHAEGTAAAFTVRWEWLREALKDAGSAKAEDRENAMDAAAAHLAEIAAESSSETDAQTQREATFARAQKTAAEVLARPEFGRAEGPSWLDRKLARFWMWVGQLGYGVGKLGAAFPWLGTALEWGFFTAAAVGLLLFVRRSFARQRLQIAMNPGAAQMSAWDREATDWASEAESRAGNSEWREAVHCLYWAAIVRLESHRAWRHNPARTPREYVRLLKPGTVQQTALRGLTGIFERVWYGLRDANAADYRRARSYFGELSDSAAAGAEQAQGVTHEAAAGA